MEYKQIAPVVFPSPTGLNINMMPIIMGDISSIPNFAIPYMPMIEKCNFKKKSTVYLTMHEGIVKRGQSQRTPGIHTDGTNIAGWGGWGGKKGIYMASTDGRCRIWNCQTHYVNKLGSLSKCPSSFFHTMRPNFLYWMTDRTPHESLLAEKTCMRQFFRLVSEDVGIWYAKYSTQNPLGVIPNCPTTYINKFDELKRKSNEDN